MAMGRPKADLVLSEAEREQLSAFAQSRSMPAALSLRARIVLACTTGDSNRAVGECFSCNASTVGKWRQRFRKDQIAGLYDELPPGKPRSIDDERVAMLIRRTLQKKPKDGSTHSGVRPAAAESGISKSSVQRYFHLFGIKPHRTKNFKLSNDSLFIEKLRAVVGLYLNPPDNALVLCVDEKSQRQALERTQPMLPLGLGYVEAFTHDYKRHGTTTLFAALDVQNGTILADCKPRHRHQQFLAFLRNIEANVPAHMDIHLIVDNYITHKHAKVKAWFAKRPHWHIHFTPTYSSWLNMVARFFALITEKAIRRSSFNSVKDLVTKIDNFVCQYNKSCSPFTWTPTADSTLGKLNRLTSRITGTGH